MYIITIFKGLGSEDCNPLNMSIEAEMAIEQMKEQHHRDLHHLKQELEDTVSCFNLKQNFTTFPASSYRWKGLEERLLIPGEIMTFL